MLRMKSHRYSRAFAMFCFATFLTTSGCKSPMESEAQNMLDGYHAKLVTKCKGIDYMYTGQISSASLEDRLTELQKAQKFIFSSRPVSDVDRLNGYEFIGSGSFACSAHRYLAHNQWSGWLPNCVDAVFGPYGSGSPFEISFYKWNGKWFWGDWRDPRRGVPVEKSNPKSIDCDQIVD